MDAVIVAPAELEKDETSQEFAKLEGTALFSALRAIDSTIERRRITQVVHSIKFEELRKDPHFKRSSAAHLVDDVHFMFRNDFAYVVAESSPGSVDSKQFAAMNSNLHYHHSFEDRKWFPRMRRANPTLVAEFDILEADHARLVKLESAIAKGDYESLVEFVASLNDHLNREELLVVPLLMQNKAFL